MIDICGMDYEIVEFRNELSGNEIFYGEIEHLTKTIRLNKDMDSQQRYNTLLHEIIHGISDLYGLDLEERQVKALGTALAYVTRKNDLINLCFTDLAK